MKLEPITTTATITLHVTASPSAANLADSLYHPPSRSAEDRQLITRLVQIVELMSAERVEMELRSTRQERDIERLEAERLEGWQDIRRGRVQPCIQGCGRPGKPVEHDGAVVNVCDPCRG